MKDESRVKLFECKLRKVINERLRELNNNCVREKVKENRGT